MSFAISGGYSPSLNDGLFNTVGSLFPKADGVYTIGGNNTTGFTTKYKEIWTKILYTDNGQVSTSDMNLKKDIEPIGDALSLIMQLKPKSFKMKNGTSNRIHTGFIAQECQDLFCSNWAAYVQNGNNIGLRYEQFISLNTRGIQQLNNRLANVEEFAKEASQKLSTDFTVSSGLVSAEEKKNELSSIYDRLNELNGRLQFIESSLTEDCIKRINNMKSLLKEDLQNELNPRFMNMNEECKGRVNELQNRFENELNPRLLNMNEECKGRVNEMYTNVINEVDSKIENERKRSNEIELIISDFQSKFNEQMCDLVDKVNILISRCNDLDNTRINMVAESQQPLNTDSQSPLHEQMVALVDKVNFLISKCDDIENLREKYGQTLENSDKIELLMSFEKSFRQEMFDLVEKVDSLSNELENFKLETKGELEMFSGLLNRVNLISNDIDNMKVKQEENLREQSEINQMNNSFEQSFRQQMLDLMEKVNLLGTDLEFIKEAVLQSSKEQKSDELELITKLIEKINILGVELQSLKDSHSEHKHAEFDLLNNLMERVNLLTADLESFKENVKQSVPNDTVNDNFESKFRGQMLDLIEKVNLLVLRCNELDLKLTNIPRHENKIELEDSDSCGSSMMETIQERLYKAEQLIGKQQKMISKLTMAVNNLLKSSDHK